MDISLADLVRQNPEVYCTNCKRKGLKCTTNQILNPSKPKKGGRRIDEARERFGGHGETSGGDAESVAGPLDIPASGASGAAQVWSRLNPWITEDFILPTPSQPSSFVQPPSDVNDSLPPEIPQLSRATPVPDTTSLLGLGPDSWMDFDPSVLPAESVPINTIDPNSTAIPPFLPTPVASNTPSMNLSRPTETLLDDKNGSAPLWWSFSDLPRETMEQVEHAGKTSVTTSPIPPPNQFENGQFFGNTFLDHTPASISRLVNSYTEPIAESLSSGQSSDYQQLASNFFPFPRHDSAQTKKRDREEISSSGSAPGNKVQVRRKDPWQLYTKEEDLRMVRWGKKEAVQEKLADRALGIELSRHLVKTFFQAVHFSYPVSAIL